MEKVKEEMKIVIVVGWGDVVVVVVIDDFPPLILFLDFLVNFYLIFKDTFWSLHSIFSKLNYLPVLRNYSYQSANVPMRDRIWKSPTI